MQIIISLILRYLLTQIGLMGTEAVRCSSWTNGRDHVSLRETLFAPFCSITSTITRNKGKVQHIDRDRDDFKAVQTRLIIRNSLARSNLTRLLEKTTKPFSLLKDIFTCPEPAGALLIAQLDNLCHCSSGLCIDCLVGGGSLI